MGFLIGILIVLLLVALFPIANHRSSSKEDDAPYDVSKFNDLNDYTESKDDEKENNDGK